MKYRLQIEEKKCTESEMKLKSLCMAGYEKEKEKENIWKNLFKPVLFDRSKGDEIRIKCSLIVSWMSACFHGFWMHTRIWEFKDTNLKWLINQIVVKRI